MGTGNLTTKNAKHAKSKMLTRRRGERGDAEEEKELTTDYTDDHGWEFFNPCSSV
jgi:hypothetical protein